MFDTLKNYFLSQNSRVKIFLLYGNYYLYGSYCEINDNYYYLYGNYSLYSKVFVSRIFLKHVFFITPC